MPELLRASLPRPLSVGLFLSCVVAACAASAAPPPAKPYTEWKHSGSLYLLTDKEGCDLPATASVVDFPVLVRLRKDWFDLAAAAPHGEDIRFATSDGRPLTYQIDTWDAARGEATIWVRVPRIEGQQRQELRIFWGKPDAKSESSGTAVFNASNGYLSVWHLNEPAGDDVQTLQTADTGTTPSPGVIGGARHFPGGKGLAGGEKIVNYPSGGDAHSSQGWFRAEQPNVTILGWGNEGGGRGSKVRMQLRSPPHIHIDSDFSDVDAPQRVPLGEWTHVVHTYEKGKGRLYLNGELVASETPTLDIKRPARLWLGGWYHHYDFVGDLDEVRISSVARSSDWLRLEYENQKPLQTLVGPVVQPGDAFSVSPERLEIDEGQSGTFTVQALGAEKLHWAEARNGKRLPVAVDRLHYSFSAGRVTENTTAALEVRAVYPTGARTKTIPISIREAIPEPIFQLTVPPKWDGRTPLELAPEITNLERMKAKGGGDLKFDWTVDGPAVIKKSQAGKLLLLRALGDGKLKVTLALSNGGAATVRSAEVAIHQPAAEEEWIVRGSDREELPAEGQFYARDQRGEGELVCRGALVQGATSVQLRVYRGDKIFAEETQKPGPKGEYALAVRLKPALVKYRMELLADDKRIHAAGDLLCGDVYLINGQSNAVATDWGKAPPPAENPWVRTFGSGSDDPKAAGAQSWTVAKARGTGGEAEIGYWGLELGKRLVESEGVPMCLINGAVGGTRIDQHQRNERDPTDPNTIYGRLLRRVRQARLTHGVRCIIWHQGENDQGADGPSGGYGWETYRGHFHSLAAAWKEDYPNLKQMYLFQIWPKACAMGHEGSDNRLREVQRVLPRDFSRLGIMSTLGIQPPGGCHYPAAGYAEFARLNFPLMERDLYGKQPTQSITPPDLVKVKFAGPAHDALVLEFDQPVVWNPNLAKEFYLDGASTAVVEGTAEGNSLVLRLSGPSQAKRLSYVDGDHWRPDRVLRGANGIAALTFCEAPIEKESPSGR